MRIKMIAGNWKMFHGGTKAADFVSRLEAWLSSTSAGEKAKKALDRCLIEVVIAPPFTSIAAAAAAKKSNAIMIAAQNVYFEEKGAFTGEVSVPMLEEAGCRYAIIGHSERRHVFGEDDDLLAKKLSVVLRSSLFPIFCVGELLQDRESGKTKDVLSVQLGKAWAATSDNDLIRDKLTIAYEPVWAIGTGKTASNHDAEDACAFIRAKAAERFGKAVSESVRILYGGSVKPENSAGILSQPNVDGLLIGGASLEVDSFSRIIESAIPNS